MSSGCAYRLQFDTLNQFATHIAALQYNEAIALGALRDGIPDRIEVTTKDRLQPLNGTSAQEVIARTGNYIAYRPSRPALALIDVDTKGMPIGIRSKLEALGGFWPALESVIPGLQSAARVARPSTSTGIYRNDTSQRLRGSGGLHVFVLVEDGADIERFLKTLHARCWLQGFGWMIVGASGQLLERSLVDRTVCAPERLVFEATPITVPPLCQDSTQRDPSVANGAPCDTRVVCPNLSLTEKAKLQRLLNAERHRLRDEAENAKTSFVTVRAADIVARTGCTPHAARKMVESQCGGVLVPGIALPFDAAELDGCTVGDVLFDPERFVGETLSDPLEGPAYGRCKAKIMRRPDGSLWVHSFAHGRTTYDLKYDFAAVENLIKAGSPADAVDCLVSLLAIAELAPDEEQRLRDLVCRLSGVKARPLAARIKGAREKLARDRAQAARLRKDAESQDQRLRLPAPAPDAERLPVLRAIDEVLVNVAGPEPPMRNLDGHPVEIRCRPPFDLHELTACGANDEEPEDTRLPPPEFPLLTNHIKYTLGHEIERYIQFMLRNKDGTSRPVALPPVFVDNYLAYRDSALPRVGAVVTAPLVLPDGRLLAPEGLDGACRLVFRIDPALMAVLPCLEDCRAEAVAAALDYLANEWLCDVATDFKGRCVLVALAQTILERVLLPQRPVFFVTAGKRGGGKTTALSMIILAVTGKKPPAAAWSFSEEERRKAMLAHLSEGLAALVWDNIPRGSKISCPTLEKVLTSDTYTDRVLCQSANLTVPTHTIMCCTGNNIGPKGDLASRALMAYLDLDRPDPENRHFRHPDPIAYTLANRGRILRCLYTILLGNPQLRAGRLGQAKTRFKHWWHQVGSAVEHAAAALTELQNAHPREVGAAMKIDFGALFAEVEGDDEELASLADVLEALHGRWPDTEFQATDVVNFIDCPGAGNNEAAQLLRQFCSPLGRGAHVAPTPKSVGRRLAANAGAPVRIGDRVMTLIKKQPENQVQAKRTTWYKVKVGGVTV
jgi:hypothetical protein